MKKKIFAILLALCMILTLTPAAALGTVDNATESDGTHHLRILFTSDMHSYMDVTESMVDGKMREHGGSARLATLIKQYTESAPEAESVIYVDGGDFSQGTLFQAGYEDYACELSMLAKLGCVAACPGNHEWDHGGRGFANMLNAAMKYNKKVPMLLCANLDFSGELNDEQTYVKDVMSTYAEMSGQESTKTTVYEVPGSGLKIGLFGISGVNSIEDSPTSGMKWLDQIESAKAAVADLEGKCDFIICMSHSGANGDGTEGEDLELAKAVPEIDFILSGHSHNAFQEAVTVGNTVIGSCGEYLEYLGVADFQIAGDGTVDLSGYQIVPVDGTVKDNPAILKQLEKYKSEISGGYLEKFGFEYDEELAHCSFDFMTLDEMYATHQEYPMGNLIADSYLYEARKNGINDIDVALVGLGTIRGTFSKGNIKVPEAFQKCSLGAGADGSAGHPLLSAYITGKELKLLVELDASLGPMVSSIKMSYAGLEYQFNTKRMLLDRVTYVSLVRPDGTREEIRDDEMYKVCCNMYAANMLGMLNGLTKGILSITPKYEDGSAVSDFYTCSLFNREGMEIKEWVAFADYLTSFSQGIFGLPEIPEQYAGAEGRKVKVSEGGLAIIRNPGVVTIVVLVLAIIILLLIAWIIWRVATRKSRAAIRRAKQTRKRSRKQQRQKKRNKY